MSLTYRMKGLDRFIRSVELKPKEAQKAVNAELARSSYRVERLARVNAPVDTGWLRSQIYAEEQKLLYHKVISPALYSVYLELGTRKMAAQPFMDPALRAEWPRLMANLNRMFKGR